MERISQPYRAHPQHRALCGCCVVCGIGNAHWPKIFRKFVGEFVEVDIKKKNWRIEDLRNKQTFTLDLFLFVFVFWIVAVEAYNLHVHSHSTNGNADTATIPQRKTCILDLKWIDEWILLLEQLCSMELSSNLTFVLDLCYCHHQVDDINKVKDNKS